MKKLADGVLLAELKKRFNENKKALRDLRVLTRKLEQVNRKLQESEALKSNFLSNIRNEIVNPLTAIMGLSEQIFAGQVDRKTSDSMALSIYREAFDLDFQLKNIFAAAELEAGETSLSVSNVDVAALIENLITSFSNQSMEKRLKVKFDLQRPAGHDGEFLFRTDPEKLQLVLANLLSNAIKYSLAGKPLKISAGIRGGKLRVSIEDRGVGIDCREGGKIFDRFKQLEAGINKSYKGHGLGLSVTKALVDRLGGKVEFTSESGKGCRFTACFPETKTWPELDVYSEEGNEFIFESEEEF